MKQPAGAAGSDSHESSSDTGSPVAATAALKRSFSSGHHLPSVDDKNFVDEARSLIGKQKQQ